MDCRAALARTGMLAAGILLITGIVTGPALAEHADHADTSSAANGSRVPVEAEGSTTDTATPTTSGDDGPHRPSSDTTLGLIAGIGAIGTAGGLVAASRRRKI